MRSRDDRRATEPRSRRGASERSARPGLHARMIVLAVALIALVLVGWAVGEVVRSVLQGADIDAVRDLARQRTPLLTAVAHVLSWAGSGFLIGPLVVVF